MGIMVDSRPKDGRWIRLDSAGVVLVLSTAQLVFGCAVWMEDLKIPLFLHALCHDLMEI